MARLIDADVFEVITFDNKSQEFVEGAQYILEMIDAQPSIHDLVSKKALLEVVHDEMKQDRPDEFKLYNILRFICDVHTLSDIDKAINYYREKVKEYRAKYVALLETSYQNQVKYKNQMDYYQECVKLNEQLADDLEGFRDGYSKCENCAGCTTWKCDCSNVRNNAVDDFAKALIPRLTDAIYQKDVEGMSNLINDVAEQLKAGEDS